VLHNISSSQRDTPIEGLSCSKLAMYERAQGFALEMPHQKTRDRIKTPTDRRTHTISAQSSSCVSPRLPSSSESASRELAVYWCSGLPRRRTKNANITDNFLRYI
jgi:hypothetical protein